MSCCFIYRYCLLPGREKGGVLLEGKFRRLPDRSSCVCPLGDSSTRSGTCGEGGVYVDPLDAPENEESRGIRSLQPEDDSGAVLDVMELPIIQGERIAAGEDRSGKKRKWQPTRVGEEIVKTILDCFQSYIFSPPSLVTRTRFWLQNEKTRFVHKSHPEYKQAEEQWKTTINSWEYEDFKTFYARERVYMWCQTLDQPYYHTLDASVDIFMKWVEDQSAKNLVEIPKTNGGSQKLKLNAREWFQWFVDILFRRLPKVNCMMIVGPSCAGKSFIEQAICTCFLNIGYLENWNKFVNTSFPFMDCVNRRVIIWNEAQVTGDNTQRESVKLLMEGAPMCVNVKNQDHTYLSRTPLIITTNNRLYDGDPVFCSRRVVFNVSNSNILTGGAFCPGQLRLHPLAFLRIIKILKLNTDIEPCGVFETAECKIQSFDI